MEKSCGTVAQTTPTTWNCGGTLVEPCLKPLVELSWNHTSNPCRTWWNPRLVEPYTSQNLVEEPWWNPGGTWNPAGSVVESWWNPGGTLPQTTPDYPRRTWWNAGGTFVEPYLKPPRTIPQPLQDAVEPFVEPLSRGTLHQTTPDHLAEPGGTLVEPLVKPWYRTPLPSQNLVEPWWNPGAQTTPDHPAALAEPGETLVENPG